MEVGEKIKKFFEKKKRDAKFKNAGPGHKLTEKKPEINAGDNSKGDNSKGDNVSRSAPSEDARKAGIAALSRLASSSQSYSINLSVAAMEAQQDMAQASGISINHTPGSNPEDYAVKGIFFKCPMIGEEVLPKKEWKSKIREFLMEQLDFEKGLTACLMIHSLNSPKDKVEVCVSTLMTYLENIIKNPDEDKYKRIRCENKIFKEKVIKLEGVEEFLTAAGFIRKPITNSSGVTEDYFVYSSDTPNMEMLETLVDALQNAIPITLTLDRNLNVLHPSQALERVALPDVFFALTPDEIKREQQLRSERSESMLVLKTKAMREKEEQKQKRKYKYSMIRVRFPTGIILQGTFGVYETLRDIKNFVAENLEYESQEFQLSSSLGTCFSDESDLEKTLLDLNLVPATVLTFRWNTNVEEIYQNSFLKSEILALLQPLQC